MLVLSNIKKLYDGTGDSPQSLHHGVDLTVDGGVIKGLHPHDPHRGTSLGDTRIDASTYTVTPGLIDCHAHVTLNGIRPQDIALMSSEEGLLMVEKVLYTSLVDGGVTTMRDIGGATHLIKRLVDEGRMIGPRLKIAICMLSTTGGHADTRPPDRCHTDLTKLFPRAPGRPDSIVDSPWECRKRVREIAACGADLIKICASPGVLSPNDALENREFSPAEIEAICDEAHGRGLTVAAHAHSESGIELAIRYGVKDIQHISFMNEKLVELADQKGCTVTPTSWITTELGDVDGISDFMKDKARKVSDRHRDAVRFAASGGLKILAGTDAVLHGMHGRNYMEVAALIDDGLSPLRAWYGGTGLAASEIGQNDTGTLTEGQRADILVCDGDVIEKPESVATSLLEVFKDGVSHRGHFRDLPRRTFPDLVSEALHGDSKRNN